MEPTERELAAHFAGMEDEVLLTTAIHRNELTDRAQSVVVAELEKRGLLPPRIPLEVEEEQDWETDKWVTIDRFRDLSFGIVARSALEAADIPCFLRDENTVRMDWQISNFIGGMRLQVLEQDREAAEAVLNGIASGTAETGLPMELDRCPTCQSAAITRTERRGLLARASILGFALPFPRGRMIWTCSKCGAQWDDENFPDD